ncbi:TPA: hypothetical protein NI636_006513 [Pseudomonas aeruginosa]|nr:hypothetical protein [Pseudomonas aeruginosa]
MPDMREEFEAWWNLPAQSELRKSCARGWAEVIWKASRAALRVELPPSVTIEEVAEHLGMDDVDVVDIAHMVNGAIAACAAFIKQAGIEVKP